MTCQKSSATTSIKTGKSQALRRTPADMVGYAAGLLRPGRTVCPGAGSKSPDALVDDFELGVGGWPWGI